MRLRFSLRARSDQTNIARHIALDNPAAALAVLERIEERCRTLTDFPDQGRPTLGRRRVLVITGTPYLAFYRIAGETITILHIRHAKQRPEH